MVQFLQVKWFEQIIVSPLPHRFDCRLGRPNHGDEDDRGASVDLAELLQEVQARLVGQGQVEENDIGPSFSGALEASGARVSYFDMVCRGGEDVAHLVREQVWVIVNQEQVGHATQAPTQWYHPDMFR